MGRRFRALKLWFVFRHYGVTGLQEILRRHLRIAREFAEHIRAASDFALMAPVPLNLVCFRYTPAGLPPAALGDLNLRLLEELNRTGKLFLTHTKLNGEVALRMVIGQTNVQQRHVDAAWELISTTARRLVPR
jgi:aromatic-L-amino-acid decarboxylase